MISFEYNGSDRNLTLADVQEDDFFVCIEGRLCQKINREDFNIIAAADGTPHADSNSGYPSMPIERIIDQPSKIIF